MAPANNLDFAIVYACVLALFSYLAFWFVPVVSRIVYARVKSWLQPTRRVEQRDDPYWFDGHRSSRHG